MQIKCFRDSDTLYVVFNENEVVETRDLDENTVIEMDGNGALISMPIEHAKQIANIENFSFQQIHTSQLESLAERGL